MMQAPENSFAPDNVVSREAVVGMDSTGHKLFTGTRLSEDQNGRISDRDHLYLLHHQLHRVGR